MAEEVRIAAAIDVGSNSVHLLLAELGGEVLRDESELLGLGAMVDIEGLPDTPVSPGSTVGGCLLVNALKAEVAERLVKAGAPPKVLTASCRMDGARAAQIFEEAYDEHAHRLAELYKDLGRHDREEA